MHREDLVRVRLSVRGKAVVSVGGRSIYIDHDGKLENSDRKSMHKGI